jgi:rhamnogalacturonyl hydrolase YesR
MGLFLAGYANLFEMTRQEHYLIKAYECADWLIQNRSQGYSGFSWGYPFDWQSIRYIPKNTPSSVVTATAGDGFYLLYKITQNENFLDICKNICIFFVDNLNITYTNKDTLCYSYTPIDDYQVHNANLFVGEFLTRLGSEIDDYCLIQRGIHCGNFALKEQQAEGYLPYWGLSQTYSHSSGKLRTDHYHSGFEIRMLYKLWKHTGIDTFQRAYTKYFRWYLRNMFRSCYIPKMTPDAFYPVNIHSCAEALLCQSTLLPDHPERISGIVRSVDWILNKMEYAPGRYAYLVKKYPAIGELRINFAMIRWGQAWMLRAYSELLKFIMKNQGLNHNP